MLPAFKTIAMHTSLWSLLKRHSPLEGGAPKGRREQGGVCPESQPEHPTQNHRSSLTVRLVGTACSESLFAIFPIHAGEQPPRQASPATPPKEGNEGRASPATPPKEGNEGRASPATPPKEGNEVVPGNSPPLEGCPEGAGWWVLQRQRTVKVCRLFMLDD
jgi:hypothetical protein